VEDMGEAMARHLTRRLIGEVDMPPATVFRTELVTRDSG